MNDCKALWLKALRTRSSIHKVGAAPPTRCARVLGIAFTDSTPAGTATQP